MRGADTDPAPSRTVVVTGLGAVTGFGWNVEALWRGLRSGRTAIGSFNRFDNSAYRTHVAAQVDLAQEPAQAGETRRRLSLADRFAVAAAREAAAQAGLDAAALTHTGVYFGSSTGGMLESELFFAALLATLRGGRHPSVGLLSSQQYNGPGDAVARALTVGGPAQTISAACASGAMAIGDALRALRRGEIEAAIAGGSDSLCRLTYGGFNSLRSVDEHPCRPFRLERTGLSIGEGAAALVLEPLERAQTRGARALAVAVGEAATCDAHHMTAPHPEGAGAADAMRRALADAALTPTDIDFINAHGTGTPLNDVAEQAAILAVFGTRAAEIPVTSTKALVGHLLGSAGALEAVATILCLHAGEVHPMPDTGTPDPALQLRLVLGNPLRPERMRHALSTSLAFGGANAALVFSRAGDDIRAG